MGLFKRAHVRGINFELVRQNLITWPNEKIAEEAADAVADNMMDEEIPEMSTGEGLSAEEATQVIDQLVDVAENIAEKTSGAKDVEFNKLAASFDYETAAILTANSLIEKAAEEVGTTTVTGDGRFQDAMLDGETVEDARENPQQEMVVPQGTTHMDTSAGEVGAQQDQPGGQPGAVDIPPTGEVAKISHLLQKLAEEETGTNPGTGEPTPYLEPSTNVAAVGATSPGGKGTTSQPKGPQIGEQMKQPGGQPGAGETPKGEVAKLSHLLKAAMKKVSMEEEAVAMEQEGAAADAQEEEAAIEQLATIIQAAKEEGKQEAIAEITGEGGGEGELPPELAAAEGAPPGAPPGVPPAAPPMAEEVPKEAAEKKEASADALLTVLRKITS